MPTNTDTGTWQYHRDQLDRIRRTDVSTQDIPIRYGEFLRQRPDVLNDTLPGPNGYSIATEAIGRVSVVIAVVLFVLVMVAIDKGIAVQRSARDVVDDFHTTNEYFDTRADLTAPATARRQLEELRTVLTQLNQAAAVDVQHLANLLPTTRDLLAAGQGDTRIAQQLQQIATSLKQSAGSLHTIAGNADVTVGSVDNQLGLAIGLVNELNNELARTTRKLVPIPAQDGFIPPQPAGEN